MKSRRSVLHFGLAASVTLGAPPIGLFGINKGGGTVTAINVQTRSFTCTWKKQTRTFLVTDKTVYFVKSGRGSWSDLRVGAIVLVKFHRSHGEWIVDEIHIDRA